MHIAESLVNFLLTRNKLQEKKQRKSHIDKNESDNEEVDDNEEIVFLTEQPYSL